MAQNPRENTMNRLIIVLLVLSLLANAVGLFMAYKYFKLRGWFNEGQAQLSEAMTSVKSLHENVNALTGELDKSASKRAVFLHHSVGEGILTQGALREKMLSRLGILVKSATYGEDIGEHTDMNDWAAKFTGRMNDILTFSHHPDKYITDGGSNDLVMFKSCFPNSDIVSDGSEPGDPNSTEKTLANYKATFEALLPTMQAHPEKLFIYMTAPPLIPSLSSPANAARARQFNSWLAEEFLPHYQKVTGLNNFAVFDLFDALAGSDNYLKAEYRRVLPDDPHPNKRGSEAAADRFLTWFEPLWTLWEKGKRM